MRGMSSSLFAQRIAAYFTQATVSFPPQGGRLHDAQGVRQPSIEVVAETGSTNGDLMARLAQLDGPLVLIAERQTAGRGRAGRTWHAEPGAVLTFSLAWRFHRPLQGLTGLPLACGVALAETLAGLRVPVQLKWPNDLLKDGRKLGGMLIETAKVAGATTSPQSWAVIGIGINLKEPVQLLTQIGQPVASLDLPDMDGNELMGRLIAGLAAAMVQFDQEGLPPFVARWNRLHAHAGKLVRIQDGERVLYEGCALGISEHGALLLETTHGIVNVMSGDVSLRAVGDGKEEKHVITG